MTKMSLPHNMAPDEIEDRAREMALLHQEEARLDAERRVKAAEYRKKLAELDLQMTQLAIVLESGIELRDVDVLVERDRQEKILRIRRADTGEIVESRAMSEEDLQEEMFTGADVIELAAPERQVFISAAVRILMGDEDDDGADPAIRAQVEKFSFEGGEDDCALLSAPGVGTYRVRMAEVRSQARAIGTLMEEKRRPRKSPASGRRATLP